MCNVSDRTSWRDDGIYISIIHRKRISYNHTFTNPSSSFITTLTTNAFRILKNLHAMLTFNRDRQFRTSQQDPKQKSKSPIDNCGLAFPDSEGDEIPTILSLAPKTKAPIRQFAVHRHALCD
ncbi:hypothetical protein BC938DRAFT_472777 [Jimgerdemannia flammicorona]|uniref:Uncharacterized protein n=1 Tax=Jimgerdemannia flammicorona TaxID=994334 RepID=A0A433Q5D2_9FUNG|nr:hypothetical protein BC938DRAFT_472777 [Jimgerdemannia flammicorona]